MEKNVFVLYLKGLVIGAFDNEYLLKCFIDGGIQNNFFTDKDIKTEKFVMNTNYNLTNKKVVNEEVNEEDEERNRIQEILKKNRSNESITKIRENRIKKEELERIEEETQKKKEEEAKIRKKLLEESDEYKILQQDKIDLTHNINKLKLEKKKLKEAEAEYNINLNLYKKFSEEIAKKSENFSIPELFLLKYSIYEKLDKENNLNFESFKVIWDKEKPKNDYDVFKSNPYEDSFISNKEDENIEIELEIPI